eukprot:220029-Chlamydomonas_euryale.AAC.1
MHPPLTRRPAAQPPSDEPPPQTGGDGSYADSRTRMYESAASDARALRASAASTAAGTIHASADTTFASVGTPGTPTAPSVMPPGVSNGRTPPPLRAGDQVMGGSGDPLRNGGGGTGIQADAVGASLLHASYHVSGCGGFSAAASAVPKLWKVGQADLVSCAIG